MKTCICVIIKDEQDYLEEWLEHHFNLGIDEIFLYEDYGSKSHADIIKSFGDKVHLESIDTVLKNNVKIENKHFNRQMVLFNWFPIEYRDKFDWVLFNDIDEYLILKMPLHDLLNKYHDKSGLFLHWKMFGANGNIKKPQGKIVDNFTTLASNTYNMFSKKGLCKSFVNLKHYIDWKSQIHEVNYGIYPIDGYGCHEAWINHYFTKSWEEWVIQILKRGDLVPGNRKISQFFTINPELEYMKSELLSELSINI